MKGTVVSTWLKTLADKYGEEIVDKAKRTSSWDEDLIISPLMNIEDQKAFDLVNVIAAEVNKEPGELWQIIGRENINSFADWFPSYFTGRHLKEFLETMDTVHKQLTKMIQGANPPRIIPEVRDEHTLRLIYRSKRGMFDYFLGLLKGSGSFFAEDIEVKEINRENRGDKGELTVDVIFAESFFQQQSFKLNRLLSLGIFKSISSKIALVTFLISLISLAIVGGDTPFWQIPLFSFINAGVVYALQRVLLAPMKYLQKDFTSLKNLNLTQTSTLKTDDEFEVIANEIDEVKENIRNDILFLKGGTDDLRSFSEDFVNLAGDMSSVSDNISLVVDDVANGAQEQAEETENSAYIVNENVREIEELVNAGSESKERLEEAVDNIQDSAREVEKVNKMIEEVQNSFAGVNEQGKRLAEQIKNIMEIVETVSDIANQTNLLSLNASIEAARSQDNSRGFTVVADEIRELAEDSRKAGERIQDNLQEFTNEVQQLVDGISSQFQNLAESNQALEQVTETNKVSSESIEQASEQVVRIVDNLNQETQKINQVIEKLNSLAAIAEENSASSEEMSASVGEYSTKIKEMTDYIEQMKELIENFQDNFAEYKI